MAYAPYTSQNRRYQYYGGGGYPVSGNAARDIDWMVEHEDRGVAVVRKRKSISAAREKNRKKAQRIGKGYVCFLALISCLALLLCVNFLKDRYTLTSLEERNAQKGKELAVLKADNDALYNNTIASVDLDKVKEKALNELGMKYPTEDQIISFDIAGNSYVRQYQDVPGVE